MPTWRKRASFEPLELCSVVTLLAARSDISTVSCSHAEEEQELLFHLFRYMSKTFLSSCLRRVRKYAIVYYYYLLIGHCSVVRVVVVVVANSSHAMIAKIAPKCILEVGIIWGCQFSNL